MYLFEIVSMEPLTAHGDRKYHSVAGDGGTLLFLEQSGLEIVRHCPELDYLESHGVSRAYTGICYDCRENCYWACGGKCSDVVYKLSSAFREVDRLQFCGYEACFGPIRAIAYDRQDDCLILTFHNRVVTVEKNSLCVRSVNHCLCPQGFQACIRSNDFYYYASRHCGSELLTVTRNGRIVIHSCLPLDHRILGMGEIRDECGPVICFLTVKHGIYYYLVKGVLVGGDDQGSHVEPACPCPDACEREQARPKDCDSPCLQEGHKPAQCPRYREHGYKAHCGTPLHTHCSGTWKNHQTHHCNPRPVYDGEHHCHTFSTWGHLYDSSLSIIESIALEQTALSHILNAEGEKIQKVVAVSDRPSDFLAVNQSVLEIITKITHLEQVLFSKLDLACGVLRDRETGLARRE